MSRAVCGRAAVLWLWPAVVTAGPGSVEINLLSFKVRKQPNTGFETRRAQIDAHLDGFDAVLLQEDFAPQPLGTPTADWPFVARGLEPANGTAVDVYTTHLDAGAASANHEVRARQLAMLVATIDAYSAGRAVVLAGDFNAPRRRRDDRAHRSAERR